MPKLFSSRQIIRVLERQGFVFVSQKGSHSKYRGGTRTAIIPVGKHEIPYGTFRSILRQSGLHEDQFRKNG